jgi:hypothetical protein
MREPLHDRRTRPMFIAAAVMAAGLSVAGIAVAGEDEPAPAPSPSPTRTPTAEDVARAQVLRQVARWAIDNGYTGLSPVSLRPIETGAD